MSALHTLLRLRAHAREESQGMLRRAEDERDTQAERVEAVRIAVVAARAGADPTDPFALATYHAFRMRQEVAERRENARLQQREREVDQKRGIHVGRVRDEIATENVIEAHAREEEREQATRDARRMDEIASRRDVEGL